MAIQEVRVGPKEGVDPRAEMVKRNLNEWGIMGIHGVSAATVYRFQGITQQEAEVLARESLTDPIMQRSSVNAPLFDDGSKRFEIGYKQGVMDPVVGSLLQEASSRNIHPQAASTSVEFIFDGDVSSEQLVTIGERLANQLQRVIWEPPETLILSGEVGAVEIIPISSLGSQELDVLSKKRSLFLNTEEMRVIQTHFCKLGREPTDVELETLAQTWSEHNGHKTFKARLFEKGHRDHERPPLIKRIKDTAARYFEKVGVVTAFADNSGGIKFYDGLAIIGKGETHNSPVAIEPYGGAETKNGGVYRDIAGTGQGGQNLLGIMINNFASPDTAPENIPSGCLPPKLLLLENSRGERDYGNKMGIPTHGITIHTHPDFAAKPTSMGIAIGIIPENRVAKGEPQPGDLLITVGGRTGRDGIHGATFSSGAMTADTKTVHSTAVQIGNAIEEKKVFDALIRARDANLVRAITDCGGGGYSSAIGEIASNVGVEVYLDKVPLKYTGLSPWEIWLSEAQERMAVAIAPENWEEFQRICGEYDTKADVIGNFTGDKILTLKYAGDTVGQLEMDFLHNGLPQRVMELEYVNRYENHNVPSLPIDWISVFKDVLSHMNVASKEEMQRLYDQSVQGRTVLYPFTGIGEDAPNDASAIAPVYGKPYGLVTAHAQNPILNRYDSYGGSIWAVVQAVSKYTAVGGNIHKAAMIDNFVWPRPTPKFLGSLDSAVDALCDMMDILGIPVVSGKDSLSSTYTGPDGKVINIPPVLNITIFGKIPDVEKTVSADIKSADSTLVLVGNPDVVNLGGSVYFQTQGIENTHIPQVDLKNLPAILDSIHGAIQTGKVRSCKTVGEGGLAATLAQMCFGGDCGANIDLISLDSARPDFALFNETAGNYVVEVTNEDEAEELFGDVPHAILGKTIADKKISVRNGDRELIVADLYDLKEAWQKPMKEVLA